MARRSGVVGLAAWVLVSGACGLGEPLTSPSSVGVTVGALSDSDNQVANSSFEAQSPSNSSLPASWTTGAWGVNTVKFTYDKVVGRTGQRSGRIDMTSFSSGDAKWIADPVPVTVGATYVYRDWYKSNVVTKLVAAFTMSSGPTTFLTLGTVPAAADWTFAGFSFVVPASVTRVTVYHLIAAVGTLQIDDVSLALPQTPDLSSGVPNGSFEQTKDTNLNLPLAWTSASWGTNNAAFTYASPGHDGTHSVVVAISSYTNGDAKWYFDPQPVIPGTRYLYSDWSIASVPSFVTIRLTMSDATYKYINLGDVPASTSYTQAFGAFLVPPGAVAATVFHGIARAGSLQMDDAALVVLPEPPLVNGVPNGDLETPAGPASLPVAWYRSSWGVNTPLFSYAADGHSGTRSARIDMTAFTSGSAAWSFDPQPVSAGQVYRLEDYYQSNVDTAVIAQVTLANGTQVPLSLPVAVAATTWTHYSTSLVLPAGAVSVTVLHSIQKAGYLQVDDMALQPMTVTPLARPLVSVTFDDSWDSDYLLALPVLAKYGATATHYVISETVGSPGRLSLDMLAALQAAGNEIGSHTVSHLNLTLETSATVAYELSVSKQFLDAAGLGPVLDFASPYGVYNQSTLSQIAASYSSHRTTDAGLNFLEDFDPMRLKVFNARSTTTADEVAAAAAEAAAKGAWLILVYHALSDPPSSEWAVTPASLDAQLAAVSNAGLTFLTVRQALEEVTSQISPPAP